MCVSAWYVQEKSQSLDMNAEVWTGLPLIKEAEREYSDGCSDDGRGGEEERERGEGDRGELGEGVRHEGRVEGELGEEGYEQEWFQGGGDGWEQRLIQQEEVDEGGEQPWEEDGAREAEQEEEEEGDESGGEDKKRRYTDEGWEERYVGEEEEEPPEISPAPLPPRDELGASQNSLNLASHEVEHVAPETEDDTQHLYATVPESHKAKKRMKMMKEAQKQERKARKQKWKMEEREEKARRKARERERKAREKSKKGLTKLQEEMGLGEAMRLQDIDTSTPAGRAQAEFIDAATAPFF